MGEFIWFMIWSLVCCSVGALWGYGLGITREDRKEERGNEENTHTDSRIEVWDVCYVNNANIRPWEDKDAVIVQIEYAKDDQYIVEVVDWEDFRREVGENRG